MKNQVRIKVRFYLILFLGISLLSGCKKSLPQRENIIGNLDVNYEFDWKTTNDYQLTLMSKESNLFEVLSSDKSIVYLRAFLTANTQYSTKIVVPSYEKLVVLKFLDQEVTLGLNSDNLSYEFQ